MRRKWSRNVSLLVSLLVFSALLFQFLLPNLKMRSAGRLELPSKTLTREILLAAGRRPSERDFLDLIRKLVLFSIREVNQRVKKEECGIWWTTPQAVKKIESESRSEDVVDYSLTFDAQPGSIPFYTVVRLRKNTPNSTHPYVSDELSLLSACRLDMAAHPPSTQSQHSDFQNLCFRPSEIPSAEAVWTKLREEWRRTDPEVKGWPPNAPMFIQDYIKYGSMDYYLKSPKDEDGHFCGPTIKMLLFIHSKPSQIHNRKAIRETFGNPDFLRKHGVRLLFMLGKSDALENEVGEEFLKFNDLVQGDFIDSYGNLTLKHLSVYNWVVTHCESIGSPPPHWLLKADDDFFLNIPLAIRLAEANPGVELLGHEWCGSVLKRNPSNKYYTPRYLGPSDFILNFLSGGANIVRTRILKAMLKASHSNPLLHMDDVYTTGILAREIGVTPRPTPFITSDRAPPDSCETKRTVRSGALDPEDMRLQWKSFQAPLPPTCHLIRSSELKVRRSRKCVTYSSIRRNRA